MTQTELRVRFIGFHNRWPHRADAIAASTEVGLALLENPSLIDEVEFWRDSARRELGFALRCGLDSRPWERTSGAGNAHQRRKARRARG